MLFDSPIFFVFLIIVVSVYWRLPRRGQTIFLLCASYFFYGWWDWRFLILMASSTSIDFIIAKHIAQSQNRSRRRAMLICSLLLNFGFLGVFKYLNFFMDSLTAALGELGIHNVPLPMLRIILPPGISFYTFQEIAYIVEVYYERLKPADSLLEYALFVSLFPHLIAGPIQRPSHLLPQVQRARVLDAVQFYDGLLLILSGLFRKCVIADNCALLANAVFTGTFGPPNLAIVLIGTYAFAWQIYGDFSGYSDIARGAAQLMGFHFMVNFRQPYLAQDLQQFWKRWHISLSSWLRDYLYIALGGNAHGRLKTYRNLLVTMLLGGLWHGANWTFVVWGGIHGVWLVIERFLRESFGLPKRPAAATQSFIAVWLRRVMVFHLVCLSWIFFRCASLHDAFYFISGLTRISWEPIYYTAFKFLACFSVPMFLIDMAVEKREEEYLLQKAVPLSRVAYAIAMLIVLTLFSANEANAFIYFQF